MMMPRIEMEYWALALATQGVDDDFRSGRHVDQHLALPGISPCKGSFFVKL
jgi:hypothetical protein